MSDAGPVSFPCERCPDDPAQARLLGLYDQRQDGLLMQRTKTPQGRLTARQLDVFADIMARFTPDYPLHLTTRQDVEFHGVRREDVPAVQRLLASAGVTTIGACGDTLRNVTCCPENGLIAGAFDVAGAAALVRSVLESLPWIHDLPRKFKISFSCCEDMCARPWINDLGFVARDDGTFRVIGAGSLGAKPGTGIELRASLPIEHVVPLVMAALKFFRAEGDRTNRRQARFRHVRQRMGDRAFLDRLNRMVEDEIADGSHPAPELPRVTDAPAFVGRLLPALGDLGLDEVRALADFADAAEAEVRLGFEHDVLVFARRDAELPACLNALLTRTRIVACPGATWCKSGIADSRSAARSIGEALTSDPPLNIALSGCPNNCAHSAVADIGLVGRLRTRDGVKRDHFILTAGGDRGAGPGLARLLHKAVPAERVGEVVSWLVQEYENSAGEEAFGDFVAQHEDRLAARLDETL